MKDYIVITIQKAFEIGKELAEALFGELMRIVEIKHMVIIFVKAILFFFLKTTEFG